MVHKFKYPHADAMIIPGILHFDAVDCPELRGSIHQFQI